jgi:DNA-binding response OmpR family regulator
LTPIDPQTAPRTYGPTGVSAGPRAARGIILYIGLDEAKAAAEGTNLTEIAQALQHQVNHLATSAETQAIIALAPDGIGSDIDAVRAVANGSQAATGSPAGMHGPVRQRIPSRLSPPARREDLSPDQLQTSGPVPRRGFAGITPPAAAPARSQAHVNEHAPVRIDLPRREIHADGEPVNVTNKEFDLLATLVGNTGRTLSREDLIDALWTESGERPDARTVDVHVRRLRRRLGSYASIVRTIRGAGYRFDEHPDVAIWQARGSR